MEESEPPSETPPPAPRAAFTPTPIGRGGMRNAWAISKGSAAPVEGTRLSTRDLDIRASASPPVQLPKKVEPPKEEPPAPPAPPPEPKNVQALHELLAKGRPQGLDSLANDHLEPPPIKAWADED